MRKEFDVYFWTGDQENGYSTTLVYYGKSKDDVIKQAEKYVKRTGLNMTVSGAIERK